MIHHARLAILAAIALLSSALSAQAADSHLLTVEAGKHDRLNPVAVVVLPKDFAEGDLSVAHAVNNETMPVRSQRITIDGKPAIAFQIEGKMAAGSTAMYTLSKGKAVLRSKQPVTIEKTDDNLTLRASGKDVIRYNMAVTQPPDGVDKIFARSGYIHPVRSPSGLVITNDFAPNHLHHHGIWFPWTDTMYEGRKVDFWNSKKAEGKVEFVKLESTGEGDVMASFRSQHRFVGMKIKGGTTILNETWDVRVYSNTDYRMFELDSTQTCATDKPLKLLNYYYGGVGLRGSDQWEGKEVDFICADGKTRLDGHATKQNWVAMYGKIDGKPCGIAVLCHPSNFRAPQKTRIHPTEPFFNFAPCAEGEFQIEPGKPYVSKYRYVTFDGEPDVKLLEMIWNDYAEPVVVKVK